MKVDWLDQAPGEHPEAVAVVTALFEHLVKNETRAAAQLFTTPDVLYGTLGPEGSMPALTFRKVRGVPREALAAIELTPDLFGGPLLPDDVVVLVDVTLGSELTLGVVVASGGKVRRLFDPAQFKRAGAQP